MGIAYCANCELGMHYTDICRGGKNGKPRMSPQKEKLADIFELSIDIMLSIAIALVPICFGLIMLIGNK